MVVPAFVETSKQTAMRSWQSSVITVSLCPQLQSSLSKSEFRSGKSLSMDSLAAPSPLLVRPDFADLPSTDAVLSYLQSKSTRLGAWPRACGWVQEGRPTGCAKGKHTHLHFTPWSLPHTFRSMWQFSMSEEVFLHLPI